MPLGSGPPGSGNIGKDQSHAWRIVAAMPITKNAMPSHMLRAVPISLSPQGPRSGPCQSCAKPILNRTSVVDNYSPCLSGSHTELQISGGLASLVTVQTSRSCIFLTAPRTRPEPDKAISLGRLGCRQTRDVTTSSFATTQRLRSHRRYWRGPFLDHGRLRRQLSLHDPRRRPAIEQPARTATASSPAQRCQENESSHEKHSTRGTKTRKRHLWCGAAFLVSVRV